MSASLPAPRLSGRATLRASPDFATAIVRVVQAAAWSARHPREPFAVRAAPQATAPIWYRAEDGWQAPLWHLPPPPGAHGAPVLLAHGLGTGPRCFDFGPARSLAAALAADGHAVFLLTHRGDQAARAPAGARRFDVDDIAAQDLPAAIARVRAHTGAARVGLVGHALGGWATLLHLARTRPDSVAWLGLIGVPVRFPVARSWPRLVALASRCVPAGWNVPVRAVHQALAPVQPGAWRALAPDLDGPLTRGLMADATEDLGAGVLAQVADWLGRGAVSDRGDTLDLETALRKLHLPAALFAAADDPLAPPWSMEPLAAALGVPLDVLPGGGHLGPLLGADSAAVVAPALCALSRRARDRAWSGPASPAAAG